MGMDPETAAVSQAVEAVDVRFSTQLGLFELHSLLSILEENIDIYEKEKDKVEYGRRIYANILNTIEAVQMKVHAINKAIHKRYVTQQQYGTKPVNTEPYVIPKGIGDYPFAQEVNDYPFSPIITDVPKSLFQDYILSSSPDTVVTQFSITPNSTRL